MKRTLLVLIVACSSRPPTKDICNTADPRNDDVLTFIDCDGVQHMIHGGVCVTAKVVPATNKWCIVPHSERDMPERAALKAMQGGRR